MKTNSRLLVSFLVSILLTSAAYAQKTDSVGISTTVKGQVSVTGASGSQKVVEGTQVFLGDVFETGDDSGVKLLFNDDTLISLGSNAELEITEFVYTPTNRKSLSTLGKGKLKSIVQKVQGNSNVEFATPNAVAGVKGTTLLIDSTGIFCVTQGTISVKGKTKEVAIDAGECTRIIGGEPSAPQSLTKELKDQFDEETEFQETVPFRDTFLEDPGKEPPIPNLTDLPGGPAPELPLTQPVDQLPGVDSQGRAPVDIIIPSN